MSTEAIFEWAVDFELQIRNNQFSSSWNIIYPQFDSNFLAKPKLVRAKRKIQSYCRPPEELGGGRGGFSFIISLLFFGRLSSGLLSGGWRGWWVATRWDVWQEASSGLLRKTQNRRKKKESESWRRGETDEKGGRTLLLGKKFLLERIHAGLAFLRLKFLHYYRFAIFFLLISEYLL